MPKYLKEAASSVAKTAVRYVIAPLVLGAFSFFPNIAGAEEKKPTAGKVIDTVVKDLQKKYQKASKKVRGYDYKNLDKVVETICTIAYQDKTLKPRDMDYLVQESKKLAKDEKLKQKLDKLKKDHNQMVLMAAVAETLKPDEKDSALSFLSRQYAAFNSAEKIVPESLQYAQEMLAIARKQETAAKTAKKDFDIFEARKKIKALEELIKKSKAPEDFFIINLLTKQYELYQNGIKLYTEGRKFDESKKYDADAKTDLQGKIGALKSKIQKYKESQKAYWGAEEAIKECDDPELQSALRFFDKELPKLDKKLEALNKKYDALGKKPAKPAPKKPAPKKPAPKKPTEKPAPKKPTPEKPKPEKPKPEKPAPEKPEEEMPNKGSEAKRNSFLNTFKKQKRHDSYIEIEGKLVAEESDADNREGDGERLSLRLGNLAKFHAFREYDRWINSAGNLSNKRLFSLVFDLKPWAIFSQLPEDEDLRELFDFGGTWEDSKSNEREYQEEIYEDPNWKITDTANVRNSERTEKYSTWAEFAPKDFKIRLAGFLDRIRTETSIESLMEIINKNDPDGNYSETGDWSAVDRELTMGLTALAALKLNLFNKNLKGYAGVRVDHKYKETKFAGQRTIIDRKTDLGIEAKVSDKNEKFMAALTALQTVKEDDRKMMTTQGHVAAGLDASPLKLSKSLNLDVTLAGDAWLMMYRDEGRNYGGGALLKIGKAGDLSNIVNFLCTKNSRMTGTRPELSDDMLGFMEKQGLRNLALGSIDNKKGWGFAVLGYYGVGKENAMGRTKTTQFGSLAAVLDMPDIAIAFYAMYKDMLLTREFNCGAILDIKKYGFSFGTEFNRTSFLLVDEQSNGIYFYLSKPLGSKNKE